MQIGVELPASVGGQDQQAVVLGQPRVAGSLTNSSPFRLAAIDGCRPSAYELAQRRAPRGQRPEQLAEGFGLDLHLGDAGAFAGNAQKFNVHGVLVANGMPSGNLMITWAFNRS